jgi:hypothetical protein
MRGIGHRMPFGSAPMALLIGCLFFFGGPAAAAPRAVSKPVLDGSEGPRTLLVLDPVDLAFETTKRPVGDFLRQRASEGGRWKVADGDSARKHLGEIHIDPDAPCKEFQCAFNAGSALGEEFVLFGTLAPLGELQAYTLNLLHVPTAQVVWARAGEALRLEDEYPFQAQKRGLEWALSDLDLSKLDLRKRSGRATVAVFDDGGASVQSKALRERAVTHLYAARRFDLVNKGEMEDLLAAMELPPPQPYAPEESLLALGKKLDVRYVLQSRLARSRHNYQFKVSMHDFEGHGDQRSWHPRPTDDFGKLLRTEDKFFADLHDKDFIPDRPLLPHSGLKTAGKVMTVGVALAAGAGLGWLAYRNKREADNEYRRFQSSQSQQEAEATRQKVKDKDSQASRFGIIGGLSIALGASIWAF